MTWVSETISKALAYHKSGDLDQAGQLYQQIVQVEPENADALHLLGVTAHQQNDHLAAIEFIKRAIAANDSAAVYYSNLGAVYRAVGRMDKAVDSFLKALSITPDYHDALFNLANTYKAMETLDEAVECYSRVLKLNPDNAEAYNNLGILHKDRGEFEKAFTCYRGSLEINPHHTEALINLAALLQHEGQIEEAIDYFRRALDIAPDNAGVLNDLGTAHKSVGQIDEAIECFRRAIVVNPRLGTAHNNLGNVFESLKQLDKAIEHYNCALEIDAYFAEAHSNMADALQTTCRMDRAAEHARRAFSLKPTGIRRLKLATMLPPVYQSKEDLQLWQTCLLNAVQQLSDDRVILDPAKETIPPSFYPVYQGTNLRDFHKQLGSVCHSSYQPTRRQTEPKPPTDQRIRIGFISRYFKNHTIGRLARGVIANLSREQFHVTVFSTEVADDEISHFIRENSDAFVQLGDNLPEACREISQAELDILYYTDIGMDPVTNSLARCRLVPVQCATWGHPVTTGIDTIDYFVSSELLETDKADDHYTERLIKLKTLSVYYYRPLEPQPPKPRSAFGLPDEMHLYICPQNLFKIHPDFDNILGEILRRDPKGLVVLLDGLHPQWNSVLVGRFRNTIPDVIDRVNFIPRQSYEDFLRLTALADVLLDPVHYSGGNTSYEAMAAGVPVVTLPSEFLRGRITHALYRKMGIDACVAESVEQYVDIAVKLGTDIEFRQSIGKQIRTSAEILFEDLDAVRELERFFLQAVQPNSSTVTTTEASSPIDAVSTDSFSATTKPQPSALTPPASLEEPTSTRAPIVIASSEPISTKPVHATPVMPKSLAPMMPNERAQDTSVISQSKTGQAGLPRKANVESCPACGHFVAVDFYDGGRQPLATLAWPQTSQEARSMPKLPLSFVRCVDCGHVFNKDFDYAKVPYSSKPNLMFNKGILWKKHLQRVRDLILANLPEKPTVVEIGCGDGHLLRELAKAKPDGRFIGFDPNAAINSEDGLIESRPMLFEPSVHMAASRPDLVISRHVLEHLTNPLAFVQALSFAASWENLETRLFIEVPCIDNVFALHRTADFYYEHNSHFTTNSLRRMLRRCATDVELIETSYNAEVVYSVARLKRQPEQITLTRSALDFRDRASSSEENLRRELSEVFQSGKRIAIWGGTGKAAALINQLELDSERFPTVVDSDLDKIGTFVPGTGQEIRGRDTLVSNPVDVILISTQWRAADIVLEIQQAGIPFKSILIEHQGRLCDFFNDEHPYRANSMSSVDSEAETDPPDRPSVVPPPKFLKVSARKTTPRTEPSR